MTLDPIQARVLGTLIEKEITTPEYYPLSLNALIAGCNQKSSRHPVMELDEEEVRKAVRELEDDALVSVARDARVPKYEHRARTVFNLRRDETAILCLLLLRGPQTPGELRSRSDRLYSFEDIGAVEATLQRLMAQNSPDDPQGRGLRPLVAGLLRQPGSREGRYTHLLSGDTGASAALTADLPQSTQRSTPEPESVLLKERMRELEDQMKALRSMIDRLESRLEVINASGDKQ